MAGWPERKGVTIGKFHPFHKGHELMIKMAAAEMHELTVIVSDQELSLFDASAYSIDYIPLDLRVKYLRKIFAGYNNVHVVSHIDRYGDANEYDEHGTAVDEDFWEYWINVFTILAPNANYFVSSDRYGLEAARRLSKPSSEVFVEWMPVDPDRELVNISARQIRADPLKYWKYIHPEFRNHYGKRILVIGPESTGKSTLTKALGQALNSPVIPEYGRILSTSNFDRDDEEEMTIIDFENIARRHFFMEQQAMMNSETGITVSDTDAFTTQLFARHYLSDVPDPQLKKLTTNQKYDLVVLLPPNLPWDDDGTRVMKSHKERATFFRKLSFRYRSHPNFLILEETDLDKRVDAVCTKLASILDPGDEFADHYHRAMSD